jgi:hypothetical protein
LPPSGAQSSIYARAWRESSFLLSLTLSAFAVGYSDSRARGQRSFEFSPRIRWLILLWLFFPCWTIFVSSIVTLGGFESLNNTTCRV